MRKGKPVYYWDSSVILAWISNESRKHGEMEGLAEIVRMVTNNDAIVITSVATRTEVLKADLSNDSQALFDRLFQRQNMEFKDITTPISDLASEILKHYKQANQKNMSFADAQHLATAIIFKVDEVHTFDEKHMISMSGNVAGHTLKICKPKGKQTELQLDE